MEENTELDYKKMLQDIDELVSTDFVFDMDCHNLPTSEKFTQKESLEMARLLGRVYSIAHGIHCKACQTKYIKK